MSLGWKLIKLKDVCDIEKTKHSDEPIPYVGLEHIESGTGRFIGDYHPVRVKSSTFYFDSNHLLYGRLRPYLNKVLLPDFEGHCSTEIFPIKARPQLDRRFLFYWFTWQRVVDAIDETSTGARMPRANVNAVLEFDFPLPSLEEQKRIVAILDEAFAGVETAIANTEKNLANARELFESYLDTALTKRVEEWNECKLSDCASLISTGPFGSLLHKSDYVSDGVPLVNPINIVGSDILPDDKKRVSDETKQWLKPYVLNKGDIVVARRGEIGRCAVVQEEQDGWVCGTGCFFIRPLSKINPSFIANLIRSFHYRDKLEHLSAGATMKNLSNKSLSNLRIALPDKTEQDFIVEELKEISRQIVELESIYKNKLIALAELKQSLLQKAFCDELTANNVVSLDALRANKSCPETTDPQFTAHMLAFGHHQHAERRRDRTYGHVKAQKLLHLAESIGGIELGREPVKNAAGPNDFQHMLKAEQWAKENDFFEFVQRDDGRGYDFRRGRNYDRLIKTSIQTMKPYQDRIDKVLNILAPLNTDQAEILATVHAAWNNLLRDGLEVTEDAIIHEARDNWHQDKSRFSQARFREAIQRIRRHKIVPDGSAKPVRGQGQFW